MMKIEKDWWYHFRTAQQGKDVDTQKQLLFEEIADLINNNRKEVVTLLKESGIETPTGATRKQIVNRIVENAGFNHELGAGLAFLIGQKKGLVDNPERSSGFAIESIITAISTPITSIFNAQAAGEQTKAVEDTNRTALLLQVLKQKNQDVSTSTVVIVGLVITGIVVGIYFYTRKKA